MKRSPSFIERIIVFKRWMSLSKKYALISCCSICKSTKIYRIESEEVKGSSGVVYTAKYECMDCHATAKVTESWS